MNVNARVCWKQSPSSTGPFPSLKRGQLHCTCSKAELEFPFQKRLQAFSFTNSALLYPTTTLLYLWFPSHQQQVDFIINFPFQVFYFFVKLQILPKFLCLGNSCSQVVQCKRIIKTMPKFGGLGSPNILRSFLWKWGPLSLVLLKTLYCKL